MALECPPSHAASCAAISDLGDTDHSRPVHSASLVLSHSSAPDCTTNTVLCDLEGDWDIQAHIRALPTKADIVQPISSVEATFKEPMDAVKAGICLIL